MRRRILALTLLMLATRAWTSFALATGMVDSEPRRISDFLKVKVLQEVLEERDIASNARLSPVAGGGANLKEYRFYSTMLVHASLGQTREILTNYRLYSEMIPYIDRANFDEKSRVLDLEGGIWKFKLHSKVRFEEMNERWIRYQIIDGHFEGMRGEMIFEPQGEKGTLAILRGEVQGERWPPAFVMERGAEIVFGYTAKRMRSYIEDQKPQGQVKPRFIEGNPERNQRSNDSIPEPRRRL